MKDESYDEGKKYERMYEDRQNTQFAGFAEAFWKKMRTRDGVSLHWSDRHVDQQLIALVAHALVGHTIDHLSAYAYDTATSGQDLWDRIPDLPDLSFLPDLPDLDAKE